MTDYADARVRDLLDAFASSDPLPGGGSAAALTGAVGMSLLLMVAAMPKSRTGTAADRDALAGCAAVLQPIRGRLTALIDEDSEAYQAVIRAYRQPKGTDAERTARTEAVQRALRRAVDVPLETMRLCGRALREAGTVVRLGNPNAATDAVVGARLLAAALEGAAMNVDVNLPGIRDAEYVARSGAERQTLLTEAGQVMTDLTT